MTDDDSSDQEADALLSRLRLIEQQPLGERAGAYEQVHDRLQAELDSGHQEPGQRHHRPEGYGHPSVGQARSR